MDVDELLELLGLLDREVLENFIIGLYLSNPDLEKRVESLALRSEPEELVKSLKKRIQSLKRGRKYIDYRESFAFSRELLFLLNDIENGLKISAPGKVVDLVRLFLGTAPAVLNRVDDSSGAIGEVFRDAVLVWLEAAKASNNQTVDWLEEVYSLYQQNDYGILDPLLPNSDILLSEKQLKQLAWRFESELRKALKQKTEPGRINMASLHCRCALGQVAEALHDPELYERSVLIDSPQPNDLQKEGIVEMYLRHNRPEGALPWLEKPWQERFEINRLALLEQVYEQMNDRQRLKDIRFRIYKYKRNHRSLERYLEVASATEKEEALAEAIRDAGKSGDLLTNADLLLKIGAADKAEALVVSRVDELSEHFYEHLITIAGLFEEQECLLGATACYRTLLLQILNTARSKAYAHGARYLRKLAKLANTITRFQPLAEHEEFMRNLHETHGRKKSFWKLVDV